MREFIATSAVFLLSALAAMQASGQDPSNVRSLSLAEALAIADTGNYAVLQAGAELGAARADARKSLAAFLPRASLSNTAVRTTDPLNVFGFRLKQSEVTQEDFVPSSLNHPGAYDNFNTRLEVSQPVLNVSGWMDRRAAAIGAQAAGLREERARSAVAFQVKQVYFEVVTAQGRRDILLSSLETARASRRLVGNHFEQGLISRAELLEADVHVLDLETRLASTVAAVENTADELRFVLGLPDEVTLRTTDSLNLASALPDVASIADGVENRSDVRALALAVTAGREQVRAAKYQFMPNVELFGAYEWNSNTLFGSGGRNWGVGATLRWNLFAGYAQIGGVERARANLRSRELAYDEYVGRSRVDIAKARRAVSEAAHRVELAESGIQQASEDLRIRSDRYREGLERTTDLLAAELRLATQRLGQLQSLQDFYISIFALEFLLEESLLAL
jgi:outer membrane protein TolC